MTGRKTRWLAVAAMIVLALAGCGGGDNDDQGGNQQAQQPATGQSRNFTFAVVTHASAGDAFWDVVKKGAEAAGTDLGVKVTYQGDGDAGAQARLIDTAVSQKVNGLVVSMANPDALKASIQAAVSAGIPVITINSGGDRSAEFGALTHVGQDERIAGEGAGERLKAAGAKNLVCVIHEAGNIGLEQRCEGAKATFGGTVKNLQVDIANVTEASATVKSALQADQSIDAVLTLNPAVAIAARDAIRDASSKAQLGTFDLNADVVSAIEAGEIQFAIDQQQYLQGYLPVTFLTLYAENLNTVGGGKPVLTGPGFVTKDNAKQVADLASKGTR
jgi:simple sugar transport system substrate-binding protein